MIPEEIKNWLIHYHGEILSFSPATGGCINNGGTARCASQKLFIKWNNASLYPGMFDAETKGLNLLRQSALRVPQVIDVFHGETYEALILENIESGSKNTTTMDDFGRKLASMHRITDGHYGLEHNNYMGSLKQTNTHNTNWVEFFITCRLEPQLKLALDKGLADSALAKLFQNLFYALPNLLVIEPPALVHGDLWGGNYMVDHDGNAVLIDPATYYGHREIDLAMTKLFGGFSEDFYAGYQETYPTEKNLETRLDIYNLYPLLIHLNLFGSSYYQQCMSIVSNYK